MPGSMTKILVKVGKSSHIKFRGVQAFRAVTVRELNRLSEINPDASIVIIENIKPSDNDAIKEFIAHFESLNNKNKVFFYVADNEDNTTGIADELAYDIYLTASDLYRAIKINCGITVDIDISKSSEINNIHSEDGFDNPFGDSWEPVQESQSSTIYELQSIESKDDIDDFSDSLIEDEDDTKDTNTTEEVVVENVAPESLKESGAISADMQAKMEALQKEIDAAQGEVSSLKNQLSTSIGKNSELSKLIKAIESERDAFRDKLVVYESSEVMEQPITLNEYKGLKDKINELTEAAKHTGTASNEQVEELTRLLEEAQQVNEATQSQIEDYKKRLRESGSRLTAAQTKLAKYEQEIADLNDNTAELEELRVKAAQIDQLRERLKESETYRAKVTELEARLKVEADSTIELNSTRDELTIAQQTIATLEKQIKSLTRDVESARSEIQASLRERDRLVAEMQSRMEIHKQFTELLGKAASMIYTLNGATSTNQNVVDSLEGTIASLRDEVEQLQGKVAEQSEQLRVYSNYSIEMGHKDNEIKRLKESEASSVELINTLQDRVRNYESQVFDLTKQVQEADKRVELARNYAGSETDKVKVQLNDAKKQIEILRGQLSDKETQYNKLVESSGMNEDGVSSLLENSRTIDEINKTLREQVVELKTALDKAEKDKVRAEQSAMALEESNKSMRLSMESMNHLVANGAATGPVTVKSIKYNGRGMIIPVFGSGSYGVTTTAMSLATKLASQASVLYIDFDLTSPKADSWFRKNPIIHNLPGIDNGPKATGLGILVDKQFKFFVENVHNIMIRYINTKAGYIDYLSGIYTKFDETKLAVTDFSALLDYCGNNYAYVIIDFGRFGSSNISNQIIKAFSEIAFKSIVVTTGDKFEIRTLRMRLNDNKVNMRNVAWLINMCVSTKIDDSIKQIIAPAKYSMVQFSPEIYGRKINFNQEPLLRDKFALFLDQIVFHK